MGISIRRVAQKAQVSISTVSRALNSSGYVSKETREKVIAASHELGYRQNSIARSLRSKRSSFIGLLVPDVSNEFFASLARVIEQSVHAHGYSLFLCNTMESPEAENRYVESLLDHQVMGVIMASAGLKFHPRILREKTAIVFVDRVRLDLDLPHKVSIESDNEQGGRIAAEELLKRDAERFVFLGDEREMYQMRNREKGFMDGLRAGAVPPELCHKESIPVSTEQAREKVKEIHQRFPFDGIFCGTDTIAIGALRGLVDLGLRIPADVQVVGFDGIRLGEYLEPPLSTIRQDIDRMGKLAAESIFRMIDGDQSGETIMLPVEFLARGSTR
jgi:LacI family transcriptional regulator